jgi:hypothetical protein
LRYSALIPADFTTFAHFAASSAISLPKSAGEPESGVPPKSASRAFIPGSIKAALISLLSLFTISAGVLLGAQHLRLKLECWLLKRNDTARADGIRCSINHCHWIGLVDWHATTDHCIKRWAFRQFIV